MNDYATVFSSEARTVGSGGESFNGSSDAADGGTSEYNSDKGGRNSGRSGNEKGIEKKERDSVERGKKATVSSSTDATTENEVIVNTTNKGRGDSSKVSN